MVTFAIKILARIAILNLAVFLILWVMRILRILALVLTYEALFIVFLGICQILGSYIYRRNSVHYRWAGMGARTGWFDFKKFAKLKPEDRKKYRQEGIIMIVIGLLLLFGTVIVHFCILAYF